MILALDPGLATCGYAIVRPRTAHVVELGVLTSKPSGADESTDRARRTVRQVATLCGIARRYEVTAIAAEAMSFGGHPKARFNMAVALCLSWGAIAGLAHALNVDLLEVQPKQWQHAILPDVVGKVDYAEVFKALSRFVEGQACHLQSIKQSDRNHALDAVGVGVYAALIPNATSIRVMEARDAS